MADVTLAEAVQLSAQDSVFYSKFFFPRTVRQEVPRMHKEMWAALEKPSQRYVGIEVFRDGAKTSLTRLYTSKRVAFGISHTIMMVSKAEAHAVRSVRWLKRQVQYNTLWAETFQLRAGSKWSEGEIEIIHGVDEYPIYVVAVGMTGQIRGINLDDFRPDLIVGDDVDDEESAGTPEQRKKSSSLFFGALSQSLAAPTEASDPRLVLLATPQHKEDIIETCKRDPRWNVVTFSCFDENGESAWPAKFPTAFLIEEKESYIARNQLAVWMREKECKLISDETASFRTEWLQWTQELPAGTRWMVAMDPASSDDPNAAEFGIVLVGFHGKKVFIEREFAERGVMPDRACSVLFEWLMKYPVMGIIVETVQYQKIMAWYLEREMQAKRIYRPVYKIDDKRNKDDRMLQAILSCAPFMDLYVNRRCVKFTEQYTEFRPGVKMLKDVLDAATMAILFGAKGFVYEGDYDEVAENDDESLIPKLEHSAECP
ncbi:terminase large subunit [Microcystis phage Mel-JY34]